MYRRVAILFLVATSLFLHRPAWGGEPGGMKRCWQRFWQRARQQRLDWKSSCRSCTQNWFRDKPRPAYGVTLSPFRGQKSRLVLFIHGLNSRPEDLTSLIADVDRAGNWSGTFRYPNDQPIGKSAKLLSVELRRIRKATPACRIVLISHSMGGLVAREAIENPALNPGNVERLIMISPPNHGSRLAEVAFSLDVLEYASSKIRRDESGFIYGSILDGLAEANDDLKPNSAFLRQLNSRPRNQQIRYTIVLGTGGPLSQESLDAIERCVSRYGTRCEWLRTAHSKAHAKLSTVDELLAGQGDGLVSVRRGKLQGVDDVIVGSFDHTELLSATPNRRARNARQQILARITPTGF